MSASSWSALSATLLGAAAPADSSCLCPLVAPSNHSDPAPSSSRFCVHRNTFRALLRPFYKETEGYFCKHTPICIFTRVNTRTKYLTGSAGNAPASGSWVWCVERESSVVPCVAACASPRVAVAADPGVSCRSAGVLSPPETCCWCVRPLLNKERTHMFVRVVSTEIAADVRGNIHTR